MPWSLKLIRKASQRPSLHPRQPLGYQGAALKSARIRLLSSASKKPPRKGRSPLTGPGTHTHQRNGKRVKSTGSEKAKRASIRSAGRTHRRGRRPGARPAGPGAAAAWRGWAGLAGLARQLALPAPVALPLFMPPPSEPG